MTQRKPQAPAGGPDNDKVVPLRKRRPCPICGTPAKPKWHPFCSKRCADIDLHRWLSGSYVITSGPQDESSAPPQDEADEPKP